MSLNLFAGVQVVHVTMDGEVVERRLAHLSVASRKVLRLLDIAVEVFTRTREKPVVCVGGDPMNVRHEISRCLMPMGSVDLIHTEARF